MKFYCFFFWWGESTGGIFPGGRMSKLSADGGCCHPPTPPKPLSLTFTEVKEGYSQLNPDPNNWFTQVVTGGYWGLLWLENYVVWIVLEPWLNTFPCMPLTCKVLINFSWARGGHLHHNVTFVFAPKWITGGRLLCIGHTSGPTVIWPMWSKIEKGPSQLFIPNHFVPLFRQ